MYMQGLIFRCMFSKEPKCLSEVRKKMARKVWNNINFTAMLSNDIIVCTIILPTKKVKLQFCIIYIF